jgi:hypothetical protein
MNHWNEVMHGGTRCFKYTAEDSMRQSKVRGSARAVTITSERLAQRNREIGAILAHARQRQQRTITECAAVLATSRRRYRAIERGDIGVEVAELEVLLPYLGIPGQVIWGNWESEVASQHVIRIRAGDVLRIIGE